MARLISVVTKPHNPKSGIREKTETESFSKHSYRNIEDKRLPANCMRQRTWRICTWFSHLSYSVTNVHIGSGQAYRATRKLSLSFLSDTWLWSIRFSHHRNGTSDFCLSPDCWTAIRSSVENLRLGLGHEPKVGVRVFSCWSSVQENDSVVFLVRLQGKFGIDHSWEWEVK